MLIFLAFLLLAEIWICIHYSTSHSLPAYWAQGVEGSSKEEGGKIGGGRRGGCTVRAINVWSSFPLRDVRASSVGLGEGLPHVSRERVLYRTGIPISTCYWHGILWALQSRCNHQLQVCTLPPAFKRRVTLVLPNLITQYAEKSSVLIPQAASIHDIFICYPAHLITLKQKKPPLQALDSAAGLPSTSLHLSPFISVATQPGPDWLLLGNTNPESWCVGDGYRSLGEISLAS